MKIEIKLTDYESRIFLYYLRRRYQSKASLPRLVKAALYRITVEEGQKELNEAEAKI